MLVYHQLDPAKLYVVVIDAPLKEPIYELLPLLQATFSNEKFDVVGSEKKGYKLRILGHGDEKGPREIANVFMKNWRKERKLNKHFQPIVEVPVLDAGVIQESDSIG